MNRRTWRYALCSVLLLAIVIPVAALGPGEFTFEESNGRYSLEAVDARVTDILAEIQQQTGIPITYDKEAPGTTTQSVKNADMERLMRLLGENVVMTFVADASARDGYRVDRIKLDPSADEATRARVAQAAAPPPDAGGPPGRGAPRGPTTYSGVGARIDYTPDRQGIRFYPLVADAPIARSGITPEDTVIEVDGKPVTSFRALTELSQVIRGKEGTAVTLTVIKSDGSVVRQQVQRAQVTYNR